VTGPRSTTPGARILTVLALVLAALAATATASGAHSRVLSTTPGSGSVVTAPPERLDVVFNSDVLPRGATLRLTDPSGQEVRLGGVDVSGPRISASVPVLTATGTYAVEYRVVTTDAHPVSATYRFSLATAVGMSARDWVAGILQGAAVAVLALGAFVWVRRSTRRRRAN